MRATDSVPAGTVPACEGRHATPSDAVRCSVCHLRALCLPRGLRGEDLAMLDRLVPEKLAVPAGTVLYREGEDFVCVHAVRSGTFKSAVTLKDGREQVMAFHLPGELMGLDGAANGHHATAATAVEDAEVCSIPYASLGEVAAQGDGLRGIVASFMAREIARDQGLMLLLGSMTAEERVACFLLNIAQRSEALGRPAGELHLPMSRAEIGSFLGLTMETVSRTISSLHARGLVQARRKNLRITDREALAKLCAVRMG